MFARTTVGRWHARLGARLCCSRWLARPLVINNQSEFASLSLFWPSRETNDQLTRGGQRPGHSHLVAEAAAPHIIDQTSAAWAHLSPLSLTLSAKALSGRREKPERRSPSCVLRPALRPDLDPSSPSSAPAPRRRVAHRRCILSAHPLPRRPGRRLCPVQTSAVPGPRVRAEPLVSEPVSRAGVWCLVSVVLCPLSALCVSLRAALRQRLGPFDSASIQLPSFSHLIHSPLARIPSRRRRLLAILPVSRRAIPISAVNPRRDTCLQTPVLVHRPLRHQPPQADA
ncbi:hypothetical protein MHUMG1_01665 [Metarhizium humberi]|uniref:Uncharacterized protein n=1 Tax=Metarhizium humberi TaxID=2596975 RepID=A0A9P8MI67_9HYPO|nr:hypothetical protein MHUMG1_01665 [Metarhizium humberi]